MTFDLHHGDCLDVLKTLADAARGAKASEAAQIEEFLRVVNETESRT